VLSKRSSAHWVLEADIKSCFDRISHEWLLAHVPTELVKGFETSSHRY
jgi:RNA-directed DNA polymerase